VGELLDRADQIVAVTRLIGDQLVQDEPLFTRFEHPAPAAAPAAASAPFVATPAAPAAAEAATTPAATHAHRDDRLGETPAATMHFVSSHRKLLSKTVLRYIF
jgi:pyruvate/2-oxoglutarate dehydrogenase complex dihydrolipoamide acyltransferase (E2) component